MPTSSLYRRVCLAFQLLGRLILRFVSYLWPKDSKLIAMGGWAGELFCDNPKYLLMYLLDHTDYHITWIGKEEVRARLPKNNKLAFARIGSLQAFWRLLNARTWFCCQSISTDLTSLPILGRSKCIDLWHGILIKKIGVMTPSWRKSDLHASFLGKLYQKLGMNLQSWVVVSNHVMANILCDGVPSRYARNMVLSVGTPRNDFLLQNGNNVVLRKSLRKKYASIIGFDPERKIVLYLPTWRMRGDFVFTFYNQKVSEQDRWKEMLASANAVLIEKHHWGTYAKYPVLKNSHCSLAISAEQQVDVDVQELLLITDVLISDYSGAYIDFALLKRPVVHFAYDLDEYMSDDSGLVYDINDVAAGPVVRSLDELRVQVQKALTVPKFLPACNFASLIEFEKGVASAKIVDFIQN